MNQTAAPDREGDAAQRRRPLFSVITAAYNERQNLPLLYERLKTVLDGLDLDFKEWLAHLI